jgi:hypothetical protein
VVAAGAGENEEAVAPLDPLQLDRGENLQPFRLGERMQPPRLGLVGSSSDRKPPMTRLSLTAPSLRRSSA